MDRSVTKAGWPIRQVSYPPPRHGRVLMMEQLSTESDLSNNYFPFRVLGVCGGIGSGKSLACQTLIQELGCWAHLEADSIAHSLYEPKITNDINSSNEVTLQDDIVEQFGTDILTKDGRIDRAALGSIVFSSSDRMVELERLVWPHVKRAIERIIQEYRTKPIPPDKKPILVLEAAVLIDAEWDDILDGLWLVRTPNDEIALERLQSLRNFSRDVAQQRLEAQQTRRGIQNWQQELENGVISRVINNEGSREDLKSQLAMALLDESSWYALKSKEKESIVP
jgi:dephospho-CoA kinase